MTLRAELGTIGMASALGVIGAEAVSGCMLGDPSIQGVSVTVGARDLGAMADDGDAITTSSLGPAVVADDAFAGSTI